MESKELVCMAGGKDGKMKNEKVKKWRNNLGKAAWMLSVAICISIVGSSAATQAAEGEVAINEANFPDENFRNYVKEFDADGNGILSVREIAAVTSMELDGQNVVNVEGIKNFPYLETLWCWHENLQELDLSGMTELRDVICEKNENLTELNVSGCKNLDNLECDNNNLRELNAAGCEKLWELRCNDNELQELNVTGCTSLRRFFCDSNHLKRIDVTNCRSLEEFECSDNELQELNISKCEELSYLRCNYNELQELDATNCRLAEIWCRWNNLTELKLSELYEGYCSVYAEGNYIDEEKKVGEYRKEWIVFPMKKYTFMGDFSKTTNTIPYSDLGLNFYPASSNVNGGTDRLVNCIRGKKLTEIKGMTYSNEAEAFYVEPFEKEKTVSFTYLGNTVEIRLVNMKFQDIRTKDWFFDPVAYVNENDLMTGMNEAAFAPAAPIARAQFAVILHRMNGRPVMEYKEKFPDVGKGIWYTDAILWASQAKVVNGYSNNGYFGPADKITREQMAAMMYRYADFKGYDTSVRKELDAFKDAADVNAYALDAMQWAVGNEIITGKTIDGQLVLDPQGHANRAECAAIIMRFMEKYKG